MASQVEFQMAHGSVEMPAPSWLALVLEGRAVQDMSPKNPVERRGRRVVGQVHQCSRYLGFVLLHTGDGRDLKVLNAVGEGCLHGGQLLLDGMNPLLDKVCLESWSRGAWCGSATMAERGCFRHERPVLEPEEIWHRLALGTRGIGAGSESANVGLELVELLFDHGGEVPIGHGEELLSRFHVF